MDWPLGHVSTGDCFTRRYMILRIYPFEKRSSGISVKSSRNIVWRRLTRGGEGGDSTISSPGMSTETAPTGVGRHDSFHVGQACPESNPFYQGFGQICLREGLFWVLPP